MSNHNTDYTELLERITRLEAMIFDLIQVEEGNEPVEEEIDFENPEQIDFSPESEKAYWIYQLDKYINGMQFKHFKGQEVTRYCYKNRNSVENSVPPSDKWQNIIPTLVVLDRFREEWGAPVKLNSVYRSPEYNRVIPNSSKKSQHVEFTAVDFHSSRGSPREWGALLKSYRGQTFHNPATDTSFTFAGGIGIYKTFAHLDTRGYDANFGNYNT